MVSKLNPLLSKAECCRYCIHLRSLNLHHFRMVEAVIRIMASRFPTIAWSACRISWKSASWFKSY
jgi:hypothetical protein